MSMKNNLKIKIFLLAILVLASGLRLYRLGSYPPLNADEAAIGYNAWSLLKTGRDEHGESWPIHFKSFGDDKPGAYFYLVLPFVASLGPNEWAIRLPSAIMGILTIYLVYLLADLLWQDKKLGLIWAFVLAVSPWHLHFSRGGWESNAALFLITLAVYLFFKSGRQKKRLSHLLLSVFCFSLAMYTYHSARLVIPALVIGLLVFNWKTLWQDRKTVFISLCFGILFLLPLASSFLRGGASTRFSGVGIFADTGPLWRVNELRVQHSDPDALVVTFLHNRYLIYGLSFVEKYFSHFDGRFLFIDGDEVPRSKLPDMGVMHVFEFALLIIGLSFWLREKKGNRYLPLLWLGVAPLASAMTFQAPSALRALSMIIPLSFMVANGIKVMVSKRKAWTIIFLVIIYAWGIFYWKDRYFNHYLKRYPEAWPINFKEAVGWIKENENRFSKIKIVTNHDQPYIMALFYLQYPPELIQKEIKLTEPDKFGFSTVNSFGRYVFANQPAENDRIIKEFPLIRIYETN